MREPSCSLVPTAKCGLSTVAPCHHSTFSAPPPPRLLGLYAAGFVWACATPAEASIWPARGAVSPSPTIVWTKRRRLKRPRLTSSISVLSSRSSMETSSSWRDTSTSGAVPVGQVPERGVPAVQVHPRELQRGGRHAVAPQHG